MKLQDYKKRLINSALIAAAVSLPLSIIAAPVSALPPTATGDQNLAQVTRTALQNQVINGQTVANLTNKVAVAFVDSNANTVKYAYFDSQPTDRYEIGSQTKAIYANIYAAALAEGKVTKTTKLNELMPQLSGATGRITLEALATHTANVPTWPDTPGMAYRLNVIGGLMNGNPFNDLTEQTVIDQANLMFYFPNAGQYSYSNFGYVLLGNALGRAYNTDFATLAANKLFQPLGMTNTTFPKTNANLGAQDLEGYKSNNAKSARWALNAYGPAGGVHSSATDMSKYALALLKNQVPGAADAMTPRVTNPSTDPRLANTQNGYTWFITQKDGKTFTHHGGTTAGFSTMTMLDRQNGKAVVLLTNRSLGWEHIPATEDILNTFVQQ